MIVGSSTYDLIPLGLCRKVLTLGAHRHSSALACKIEAKWSKICLATLGITQSSGQSAVKLNRMSRECRSSARVDSPWDDKPFLFVEEAMVTDVAAFFGPLSSVKGY
jgi:hypothetical protein